MCFYSKNAWVGGKENLRSATGSPLTLPPTHSLRGVANAFGTQANSLRGVAIVGGFLGSPQRDMAAPPTERKGVVKTPLDSPWRQSPKVLLTCARVASWVFHQGWRLGIVSHRATKVAQGLFLPVLRSYQAIQMCAGTAFSTPICCAYCSWMNAWASCLCTSARTSKSIPNVVASSILIVTQVDLILQKRDCIGIGLHAGVCQQTIRSVER